MRVLNKLLKQMYKLDSENFVTSVVMDSRLIEKGALFFAINNGNSHIEEALEKGASLIIADRYEGNDSRVIKVLDTVEELQKIAKNYREKLDIKIIAITGSNGKTTTKDIIYAICSQKFKTKKTEGNYNNHIGLPYTLLQLREDDEVAVLELGMSSLGEIKKLCEISTPDIGVITNIGDSHMEHLRTRENVFKAKTELVPYIRQENLFFYGDDIFLKKLAGVKIGFEKENDYLIKIINEDRDGVEFYLNEEKYHTNLNGVHNCINSSIAIAVAKLLGIEKTLIESSLDKLVLTKMRFEKIQKENNLYINDAYNASPISMKYALETFDNLYNDKYSIAVLGDMLELGEKELEFHKEIIITAIKKQIKEIILYGKIMLEAFERLQNEGVVNLEKVRHIKDKSEIKNYIINHQNLEKSILLKGSRGMKLEDII